MISMRTSCDRARAIETTCCAAGRRELTRTRGSIPSCPRRVRRAAESRRIFSRSNNGPRQRLVRQEDALRDREVLDQIQLLVDRGDAAAQGRGGVTRREWLAVDENLAAGRLDCPGDALDQGRLARAIGPQKAVDLARAHVEVHSLERLDAGVLLDEAADLEHHRRLLGDLRGLAHAASTSGRRLSRAISRPPSIFSSEPPHSGSSCSTERTPSKPPSRSAST